MRQISTLLVAATALMLAACGSGGDTAPEPTATVEAPVDATIRVAEGAEITIGISAALSGDQVNLGTDIADAAELAVEEFGGRAGGHPINVRRLDDGCTDPEKAEEVANRLIAEEALAGVIGPMCTTGAQAANDEYERAQVIHLSPSATRVDLSAQGERFFFRTSWRDDAQARLQADYAIGDLDAGTAVVIDDGDPYGAGLADAFIEEFEDGGGQVLSRERIARGTTDFTPLVRLVAAASPDIVVFQGLNPEGALLVTALRGGEYKGAFMAPDGLLSTRDFIEPAGASADGAVVTGGPAPEPDFIERFSARFGRPPSTPFVLQSYDAMMVLLRAIDSTARVDGGRTIIDRIELAEAVRSTAYEGLTGSISFDERGDRAGERAREIGLRIYRVAGEMFEPVD